MKKLNSKKIDNIVLKIGRQIFIYDEFPMYEEFKQININGNYIPYLISSFGRVFSLNYHNQKGNIQELKTSISRKGYKCIIIRYHKNKFNLTVHRLVAHAFIKNDDVLNKTFVNHIDGIKTHNYVWNLEWITPKGNVIHAERTGLSKHLRGIYHPNAKVSEISVINVCKLLSTTNKPIDDISIETGVSKNTIKDIKRGKTWRHISKDYDFSKYNFGHEDISDKVHIICKYAESNKYTMRQISEKTGVPYPIVNNIVKGKNYTSISSIYNIGNFNKYKTKSRKYK